MEKKMTNHVQKDRLRKSNLAYKRGRANACRQKKEKTAQKKKEKQMKEKHMKAELDWT